MVKRSKIESIEKDSIQNVDWYSTSENDAELFEMAIELSESGLSVSAICRILKIEDGWLNGKFKNIEGVNS